MPAHSHASVYAVSVISITIQVMTHSLSSDLIWALRPSASAWERQATLAAVSLTGHLLHRIAAPSDDGALLPMRVILLAT